MKIERYTKYILLLYISLISFCLLSYTDKELFYSSLAVCSVPGIKPIITYTDLSNTSPLLRKELGKLGGIYGIVNTETDFKYIGSSLYLYSRLMDHIKGRDSNIRLQRAINKVGLDKFNIAIYYYHTDPAVLLTDIETTVIASFDFSLLYNFKKEANSMYGYKHTEEAKEKMKLRFMDKENHPMYGKKHNEFTLSLISKPGQLNPMFGKNHSDNTRELISIKNSKRPIGLYNINNELIETFINQVDLASKFNVHKTTISRYIKNGKLFNNEFIIKEIK